MTIIGGPNPIFLGQAGLGKNFGQIAPQLKTFDVFYCQPPVVGFHVVPDEPIEDPGIAGLKIEGECDE